MNGQITEKCAVAGVPNIRIEDVLPPFDMDGELASNASKVQQLLEGKQDLITTAFWTDYSNRRELQGKSRIRISEDMLSAGHAYQNAKFGGVDKQEWVDMACDFVARALATNELPINSVASMSATIVVIKDCLVPPDADPTDERRNLMNVVSRIGHMEAAVIASYAHKVQVYGVQADRRSIASNFESSIAQRMRGVTAISGQLSAQSGEAAETARSMHNKTSEVAAAAEQSALAMREAARTAAGLIRAIEMTRREVEDAAEFSQRASQQAAEALELSTSLSDHAQSIESILGLIREVAGQTNLLALNATIEAARAGEAGRGFAVVAQEVKGLANQTARATDDIASKIAAIQAATRDTVAANASIQETMDGVSSFADRVRSAMDAQAQTVTTITAAVDETALAADSMSTTIAAIRQDTDHVVAEMTALENGVGSISNSFADLASATQEFASKVA